jgi:endonuclease/exonuclease/phosphatase family metal-dependent hydrolase
MGATEHRFVAALAGTPGATWMAATGEEQPDSAGYGVALLSRLPVVSWQVVRLSSPPTRVPMRFHGSRLFELVRDEPRVAVAARVETPRGELTVATAHLSFVSWWGRQQLRRTIRGLDGADPLVLMGDLNMSLARAMSVTGMRSLLSQATFPAHAPREQLDHVLTRGDVGEVRAVGVERLPLSDHCAVTVDLH